MFKSLRWTLQLWHAAILLLAIISFGIAMYGGVARARYRAVDAELEGAARAVIDRLRAPPPPPPRRPAPSDRPRRPEDFPPPPDEDGPPEHNNPRPPLKEFEPPPPPQGWHDRAPDFGNLPRDLLRRVGVPDSDQPYYTVWRADGSMVQSSSDTERASPPHDDNTEPNSNLTPGPLERPPAPPPIRDRAGARELILPGPRGTRVIVGRSIAREAGDLRQLFWTLVASGAGVIAVGLVGGWLLAGRAIRPIHVITQTARSISSTDLSRRIEGSHTQSELGALAETLNDTFARLDAAFKRQSQFTADASHELRTPLSVIHTSLELALTKDRSGEEYRQTLAASLRASRRMTGLVESLLMLARADAGTLQLRKEPIDLGEVAVECAAMFRSIAEEKKIQIDLTIAPAAVVADRMRLSQVITNLLSNAIHYNRDAGSVMTTVRGEKSKAVLTVSDTGIGINADELPRVFERFFRADRSRTRDAGGSGLGLAICKSIVEAHGGTIAVQSRAGAGTTFVVVLPADESLPN